jgi:hypothetical protein
MVSPSSARTEPPICVTGVRQAILVLGGQNRLFGAPGLSLR